MIMVIMIMFSGTTRTQLFTALAFETDNMGNLTTRNLDQSLLNTQSGNRMLLQCIGLYQLLEYRRHLFVPPISTFIRKKILPRIISGEATANVHINIYSKVINFIHSHCTKNIPTSFGSTSTYSVAIGKCGQSGSCQDHLHVPSAISRAMPTRGRSEDKRR
jgi:hypothetical protein